MKIVYAGNNQRGIACLEALSDSKHDVVHAIAQDGEEGWFQSIENTAKQLKIPVSVVNSPNTPEFLKQLQDLSPDLVVMCGYSKIVRRRFREIPKYGCINLHASALPFYRGAAPLNWAIINGEKEIGLSIYQVDKGIDTGPIIAQERFTVGFKDTIKDVSEKVLEIYPKMLLKICDDFESGNINPIPQNLDEGSYFTKRYPKDGEIKWDSMIDVQVYNLVRALTDPYPCAFFYIRDDKKKIKVLEADIERKEYLGIPGRIAAKNKEGLVVITRNRGIRLKKLKLSDGNKIDAENLECKVGEDLI